MGESFGNFARLLRAAAVAAALGACLLCAQTARPGGGVSLRSADSVYLALRPGAARAARTPSGFTVGNNALALSWRTDNGHLRGDEFTDGVRGAVAAAPAAAFTLLLDDFSEEPQPLSGRVIRSSEMEIVRGPTIEKLRPNPTAAQLAERLGGESVTVELETPKADDASKKLAGRSEAAPARLHATWRAILLDGSNYIRQQVTLRPEGGDLHIAEVRLVDWNLAGARVSGVVLGSPIVAGDVFTGFEHPLSHCAAGGGRARCWLSRELPLRDGTSVRYSEVVGISPPGQMRRAFLFYLERERAHPYRTFLHYNSWYDLGEGQRYSAQQVVDTIRAFGRELTTKRGVKLSSFLLDDGWDDPHRLWQFNSGFPDGLIPVREAAGSYGAGPGIWMSPWGGYAEARQERVAAGRALGYEIIGDGFALSGPKYYRLFLDTSLKMIRDYGVNQFKFDGTGNANRVFPGSAFDSDFDAAISLIGELRRERPGLFINLTTGTYPSPFWLRYADSTWRGGDDHSFAGVGPDRERWITYRDGATYEHIVLGGPLYPLNSLMLHGIIYARYAGGLATDPENAFRDEVRSYFATGTQLQEMYITPALLTAGNWDDLAEAANWSRRHAGALVDTHWVGGDPLELEAYGWAAWRPGDAVLALRNPSDRPQTISLDIGRALELPAGAPRTYRARSPWKADADQPALTLRAGTRHEFALRPFEVLTYDLVPAEAGAAKPR
jgi:hypothetical protein